MIGDVVFELPAGPAAEIMKKFERAAAIDELVVVLAEERRSEVRSAWGAIAELAKAAGVKIQKGRQHKLTDGKVIDDGPDKDTFGEDD